MKFNICIITKLKDNRFFNLIDSIKSKTSSDVLRNCVFYVCYTGDDPSEFQKTDQSLIGFRHHTIRRDYNFAKNSNELARLGDGEALLFLNDDIELIDDCITKCYQALKTGPDDLGTVGVKLIFPENTIQHAGQICVFENGEFAGVGHMLINSPDRILPDCPVFGNTGAFLGIRRKVFEKTGGFDEKFESCFEDVKLNSEILTAGYRNFCLGSVAARHFESTTRGKKCPKEDIWRIACHLNENAALLRPLAVDMAGLVFSKGGR